MSTMMDFSIRVKNLHCDSCERVIKEALVEPLVTRLTTDLTTRTVSFRSDNYDQVIALLTKKGFEVDEGIEDDEDEDRGFDLGVMRWAHKWAQSRAHRKACKSCQEKQKSALKRLVSRNKSASSTPSEEEEHPDVVVMGPETKSSGFKAVYAIGGMTCASCVNSIQQVVRDKFPGVELSVDLMSNSGTAYFENDKRVANEIKDAIEDSGFDCEIINVEGSASKNSSGSSRFTVTASIDGMSCASCANSISAVVSGLVVTKPDISVLTKSGKFVVADKNLVSELKERIEDAGFDFTIVSVVEDTAPQNRTVRLAISGMFCGSCPKNVLESIADLVQIESPPTLDRPKLIITYNTGTTKLRDIAKRITETSPQFKVSVVHPPTVEQRSIELAKKEKDAIAWRMGLAVIVAIPTFIIGIVAMQLAPKTSHFHTYFEYAIGPGSVTRGVWAMFVLATPVYFCAADIFHRKAIKEVKSLWSRNVPWSRRIFKFGSMNLLMSLGTTIAYFASLALLILSARSKSGHGIDSTYFDSVVFLTMFLLIGRLLDSVSKSKTTSAVNSLGTLRPDTVELYNQETQRATTIDSDFVEANDTLLVRPGTSLYADGVVVAESSRFDESTLTGESIPVEHGPADQVYGGTVNVGSTSVVIKVTATQGSSLIDSIISAVRDGNSRPAPITRFAEKLTGIFVPIVTALAVATWVIWLALGYSGALPASYLDIDVGGWVIWSMQFAISVFVVACPCGIGLAAPTALFVGTGVAAKNGILPRGGGQAFQEAANVDVVCFDKTGTLTEGSGLSVSNFWGEESLLGPVGQVESHSAHPLAVAVREYALSKDEEKSYYLTNILQVDGKGMTAVYQGKTMYVGNEKLMVENNIQIPEELSSRLSQWKAEAKSVILVGVENSVLMAVATSDKIRPEAAEVIATLQNKYGKQCWMITGDNEETAKAVAKAVGIPEANVLAHVLPADKASQVQFLQRTTSSGNKRSIVAMIGDGVNDAPALAAADVSIAVGSGSDLAVSTAHFILMSSRNELTSLVTLLDLSKTVLRRIRLNFGWALVYNMVAVPVAAGTIYPAGNARLDPAWASLAMALSSISVVMSSYLLKFYKPPKRHAS
ncbi:copper-transporting ATPase [Trichomonascus vanleenenianus]|uniref:heavy metal translocating P-type ATPase n=1 Tax=Trichomonascus vanleenenianus TaxID=2268995 RepID=UPI003ECAA182